MNKTYDAVIIGAGPAGLSAAYYLATRGYKPTVFEKSARPGGMAHKFFLSAIGLRPFLFDLQSKHTVSAGTKLLTRSNKEALQNEAHYKHISPENVCSC